MPLSRDYLARKNGNSTMKFWKKLVASFMMKKYMAEILTVYSDEVKYQRRMALRAAFDVEQLI